MASIQQEKEASILIFGIILLLTELKEKNSFKVMYCTTGEMIAGFFTKPLQGAQFYKFRDAILGIKAEDEESYKQEYLKILEQYGLLGKENDEIT
jgi:hypothetical protein